MDPLSGIASTVALIQAASSAYKAIQHIKSLPEEFIFVETLLPLIEDSLAMARTCAEQQSESDSAALCHVLNDCHKKALDLNNIFEHVQAKDRNDKGDRESFHERYRNVLRKVGKANRVEELMQALLNGVVEINEQFRAAVDRLGQKKQLATLENHIMKAIDTLSSMESSVSDAELDGDSRITVHIAEYVGSQSINTGGGTSNSGFSFNSSGGPMNIGMEIFTKK